MKITVELPDDWFAHADPRREALEAIAIAGYRQRAWGEFGVARLLDLGRLQVDDFLAEHGVEEHAYGMAELARDREAVREMRAEGLLHQ